MTDARDDPRDRAVDRGVRVGVAAYLIWGFLTVYWKQLEAFDAIELIGWRMLTAAVVMALLTTVGGSWPQLGAAFRDTRTAGRILLAAILLTINWGSYVWAVVNDRVIETALGYFIAPLATMAIGVFVFDERPTGAQRFAFGCASCAVAILTVVSGRPPWIALVLAGTWSLYGLTKRRVALGPVASLSGETFVLLIPAIAIVAISSTRADSVVSSASTVEWGFALGTGLITAIPLTLFASAAKSIPFTLLGPLNLLVPVINFALGWVLYAEPMPVGRFVGFAFVWVALVVVMAERVREGRRPVPPDIAVVT